MTYGGKKEFILAYDSGGEVQNGSSGVAWQQVPGAGAENTSSPVNTEPKAQTANGARLWTLKEWCMIVVYFFLSITLCFSPTLYYFLSLNEFLTFISYLLNIDKHGTWEKACNMSFIIWFHFAQHDLEFHPFFQQMIKFRSPLRRMYICHMFFIHFFMDT